MAAIRPFRGLRYAGTAGPLASLLAPPSESIVGADREAYASRHIRNAVGLALPEGHSDDRSKFVRYARAAALLAEWRRDGALVPEGQPAFYRLSQRLRDEAARVTLLAVVEFGDDVRPAESFGIREREDRLRLLEATRTAFEPSVAFYADPKGAVLRAVREAPAASEIAATLDNGGLALEAIDDPDATGALAEAFGDRELLVADGIDGFEAARTFPGATGAFVALASLDDPAFVRLAVHRVVRRFPGAMSSDTVLVHLSTCLDVEAHHSRNLGLLLDREAGPAFGLATEGGLGYLLRPREVIEGPASAWFVREILGSLLGVNDFDPSLNFVDPLQASRTTDEGAAAAFLLPPPGREDLVGGSPLPHRVAVTYPAVPTGLVFWSMGDDV